MTTSPSTPPRSPTAPSASRLVAWLRRVRRVWWTRAVGGAFVVAAVAALAVVPIAWLLAWRGDRDGRLLDAVATWGPAVLIVFGLALLGALIAVALRAPTLLQLARRADRVLGQQQRLSTALEVQASGRSGSLVSRALVDDVDQRVRTLDGATVPRERWPAWGLPTLATVVVAALLAWFVPIPADVSGTALGETASVSEDRLERDAAAVRRFAEMLASVADTEDSDYLQAVASSFADLADQLDAGTIDAATAARTLDELVQHLEAAAEDVSDAFAEAVRASLSSVGDEAVTDPGADADTRTEAASPEDAASAGQEPAADASGIDADASIYMAMEDFANEVGRNPGGVGLRAQRPSPQDLDEEGALYGGVLQAERDPDAVEASPSGLRADGPGGGGDVVGAAEQSSERAGDAAGAGSADLEGRADGFLDLDAASAAVAALPANQRDDGRFVDVELVPDEELGRARGPASADDSGFAFRRSDEAATTVRSIRPTYREIVGRYFMPGAITAETAP